MFEFNRPEARVAVSAVREAALLIREIQQELVSAALSKDDRSPVTVADYAAQALVSHRLAEELPGQVLIGEENADALAGDAGREHRAEVVQFVRRRVAEADEQSVLGWIDRGAGEPPASFWTLDPVDGTKGFLRHDQYAVALGYVENGRVQVGVLGCPELGDPTDGESRGGGVLLVAVRGEGSWTTPLNGAAGSFRRLHVSDRTEPQAARLLRSVESAHTNTGAIGELVDRMKIEAPPVPMDSQAKYAVLAAGGGDVLVRLLSANRPDYREKIWDQAAGSLVVEEAGGKVTDLDGQPLDFSRGRTLAANRGVLATNGHLHQATLAALRDIGA